MSTYQLRLLLEALASFHSFRELAEGRVVADLVRHLGLSPLEAEAIVFGALQIKKIRSEKNGNQIGEVYLQ